MTQSQIAEARQNRSANLRAIRIKSRLSKEIFSKMSGLSRPTIDTLENGDKGWNIDSELIYLHTAENLGGEK